MPIQATPAPDQTNKATPAPQSGARKLAYIGLFVALISVCAWISIPTTVPFTLQTLAIFLAAGLLGPKYATAAVGAYLLLGAVGVPVFAGFRGGFAALAGPTGGYLVGFLLTALLVGAGIRRFGNGWPSLILSMTVGLVVCYAFGTAWFLAVYAHTTGPVGLATALGWCVFPFLLPDAAKIAVAAVLIRRLAKYVQI